MQLEERKIREIAHSDKRRSIVKAHEYSTDSIQRTPPGDVVENNREYLENFSNMKFYSISEVSFAHRDTLLFAGISGAIALDYCCGNGEVAIEMAKRGAARVIGIDISTVAIENAQALARREGVADICAFEVMDAEHTTFPDGTFDVVHEYGALHHLDLHAALTELSRILKINGKLICTEALRHNPLIHWYRKRTPHLRTTWEVEHILGVPEIESGKKYFDDMNLKTFHLASLVAVPFRRSFVFPFLLKVLNWFDQLLLSLPFFRRMAWVAVVEYKLPVRKGL